jgi:hypothetical protein
MVVSKGEFAKMLGKHPAYVDTYIKRNQIVTCANGKMIDITNEANVSFMRHIQRKNEIKEQQVDQPSKKGYQKKTTTKKTTEKKVVVPQSKPLDYSPTDPSESNQGIYNIKIQKEQADLDKKLLDAERVRLVNAKMRGENVPTLMVKNLIAQLSKSFISNYKEAADRLLIEISHRKKLSVSEEAEMKGLLVKIINESHDRAINEADKQLETIISVAPQQDLNEDTDE